jgi:hypothetical protein
MVRPPLGCDGPGGVLKDLKVVVRAIMRPILKPFYLHPYIRTGETQKSRNVLFSLSGNSPLISLQYPRINRFTPIHVTLKTYFTLLLASTLHTTSRAGIDSAPRSQT